jgi:hypothetical protein
MIVINQDFNNSKDFTKINFALYQRMMSSKCWCFSCLESNYRKNEYWIVHFQLKILFKWDHLLIHTKNFHYHALSMDCLTKQIFFKFKDLKFFFIFYTFQYQMSLLIPSLWNYSYPILNLLGFGKFHNFLN